jgi:hypothetical protein
MTHRAIAVSVKKKVRKAVIVVCARKGEGGRSLATPTPV